MTRRQKKAQSQEISTEDIPHERVKDILPHVSPPLKSTRLSHLILILLLLTALIGTYYSYRILQYRTRVGGWWNLALGRWPQPQQPPTEHQSNHAGTVEDKINDLARALGMPSRDLASAIAVAVRNHVSPASISSIAAKETGPAVQVLLQKSSSFGGEVERVPEAAGYARKIAEGIDTFVGMEVP